MEEICELPNGCTLFRKPDEVGGFNYYSDEIGGGVHVWNTSLVSPQTLMTAIIEESRRERIAHKESP